MQNIFRAFSLSFKYIKPYHSYWFYFCLRIIQTVIDVLIPVVIGYIIILITNHVDINRIYAWSVLLICMMLITPIIDKISFVNAWYISFRASHNFRRDIVKKIEQTGLSFWQTHDRGNVLKIIDQAFENFTYINGNIVHSYVPFIGKIVGIVISTVFIDPVILLFFSFDAILFIINIRYFLPKETKAGLDEKIAQEVVYGQINEYLTNYKTVLYLNLFQRENEEIFKHNEKAYNTYVKRETISGWKWFFNHQIHAVSLTGIIIYSLWQVLHGNLPVGFLATIIFFSLQIAQTMSDFVWQFSELVKMSNSIKRYTDTFDHFLPESSIVSPKKIDFEQLTVINVFVQHQERETLKDVSLKISKGEKVAIVGFTGSGKTTLIDILLKAVTSYTGEIFINHENYQYIHVQDIAKIYSIVPQEVQLFQGTLHDNIVINKDSSLSELTKVLTTSSLQSLIEKLPKGVDSHINEGASNISGGERQRIGIARALLQRHPVLILDEATASLDPKTERDVITNIMHEYPELTVLYITHKYSLLNLFDHIIVMNDGTIIEQGSFDSLVEKGGLFKDLFDASQMQ